MIAKGTKIIVNGEMYRNAVIEVLNLRRKHYIIEHIDALYNKLEADAELIKQEDILREENKEDKK